MTPSTRNAEVPTAELNFIFGFAEKEFPQKAEVLNGVAILKIGPKENFHLQKGKEYILPLGYLGIPKPEEGIDENYDFLVKLIYETKTCMPEFKEGIVYNIQLVKEKPIFLEKLKLCIIYYYPELRELSNLESTEKSIFNPLILVDWDVDKAIKGLYLKFDDFKKLFQDCLESKIEHDKFSEEALEIGDSFLNLKDFIGKTIKFSESRPFSDPKIFGIFKKFHEKQI
jgi:hypothetical protein